MSKPDTKAEWRIESLEAERDKCKNLLEQLLAAIKSDGLRPGSASLINEILDALKAE